MINLTDKNVENYDAISKEAAALYEALEAKKGEIHNLIDALKVMEEEIEGSLTRLNDLRAVTEKEVLRLESLTINDDSMSEAENKPETETAPVAPEKEENNNTKESATQQSLLPDNDPQNSAS